MSLQFTFSDDDATTKVVFIPHATGGPPPPVSQQGPRLNYKGVEGNFSFLGDQIGVVESPLGSLITVTLTRGEVELKFTLVLPPVIMADQESQSFDSIAIKTESTGGILPSIGVQLIYKELLRLHGVAEVVEPVP